MTFLSSNYQSTAHFLHVWLFILDLLRPHAPIFHILFQLPQLSRSTSYSYCTVIPAIVQICICISFFFLVCKILLPGNIVYFVVSQFRWSKLFTAISWIYGRRFAPRHRRRPRRHAAGVIDFFLTLRSPSSSTQTTRRWRAWLLLDSPPPLTSAWLRRIWHPAPISVSPITS